jgi:hypothetical protein
MAFECHESRAAESVTMITAILPGYYPTLVQNQAAAPLVSPVTQTSQAAPVSAAAITPVAQPDTATTNSVGLASVGNTAVPATNVGVGLNGIDDVNDLLLNQLRSDTLGAPATQAQVRGGGLVGLQAANPALDNTALNTLNGNDTQLNAGLNAGQQVTDNAVPILGTGQTLGETVNNTTATQAGALGTQAAGLDEPNNTVNGTFDLAGLETPGVNDTALLGNGVNGTGTTDAGDTFGLGTTPGVTTGLGQTTGLGTTAAFDGTNGLDVNGLTTPFIGEYLATGNTGVAPTAQQPGVLDLIV